ncbi:conserved protein of unknown function [Burkholderia multivorans]
MTLPDQPRQTHYEVNVCGGEFGSVRERFRAWKLEPLVSRPDRLMFEGKTDVRQLDGTDFDSTEAARRALELASWPQDDFALAAHAHEDGLELWIVLAAYEE